MALSDFRFELDNTITSLVVSSRNFMDRANTAATQDPPNMELAGGFAQIATQAATQAQRLAEARKAVDGLT